MDYISRNLKIKKLIINHQFEKAINILHHQIAKNKDTVLNYLTLYQVYMKENDISNAIIALESTKPYLSLADNDIKYEVFSNLGEFYYWRHNYKKAFGYYQKALHIKKDDCETLFMMGRIYLDLNDLSKSGQIFDYILKKDPENVHYQSLKAYQLLKSKKYDEANQLLKDILNKMHEFVPALFCRGYYHYLMRAYDKALEYFKESAVDKEYRFESFYYSGKCEVIRKAYRSAIDNFVKAKKYIINENLITLDLHYNLVLCYEDTKEYEKALVELRAIHKVKPDYKDIAQRLISENYQNIANSYLLDYNGFSEQQFLRFSHKLLSKFNLKTINHKLVQENLLIIEARIDKYNKISQLLDTVIHNAKKEKIIVIFSRGEQINEKTMAKILKLNPYKYNSGVFLTSGEISPLAITFSKKRNLKTIIPSFLNDIIKELTE